MMKDNINRIFLCLTLLFGILFFGTSTFPAAKSTPTSNFSNSNTVYNKPILNPAKAIISEKYVNYIVLNQSYTAFKEALAFKESRGRYHAINDLGYLGKYQFGVSTLKLIGIDNPKEFLNSPQLQEKAFLANTKRNKWVLRRDIKRFVGQKINNTLVTESGILAAAHLAGPGSVKRYLRSSGKLDVKDSFGTHISCYIRKFSSYDTSFVVAQQFPKIK